MSETQATRLRAALLDPHEASQVAVEGSVTAAVLVALFERDRRLWAVFTRRPAHLRLHAGQVSFPGGRREDGDADLTATALREASEEIGLQPSSVTILGALPPTPTIVTDIAIYPIVGLIEPPSGPWSIDPAEVDGVIEAPLAQLAASHRRESFERANGLRVTTDAYTAGDDTVWGATARIVRDLLARVH